MLAWMDRHAIQRTLAEGQVVYYSRSRQAYWRKGETSGHFQDLVSMYFDCDGTQYFCASTKPVQPVIPTDPLVYLAVRIGR